LKIGLVDKTDFQIRTFFCLSRGCFIDKSTLKLA